MFCCTFYVPSSVAIILMGNRELAAFLSLSSCCLVIVVWLLLKVQCASLQFVIVVNPDHTHLLLLIDTNYFLSFSFQVTVPITTESAKFEMWKKFKLKTIFWLRLTPLWSIY